MAKGKNQVIVQTKEEYIDFQDRHQKRCFEKHPSIKTNF